MRLNASPVEAAMMQLPGLQQRDPEFSRSALEEQGKEQENAFRS